MTHIPDNVSAFAALQRLCEGNRRFTNERGLGAGPQAVHTHRGELATGQSPFAVILGCSDSRVPAEIVFDQGLGDLFVVRVAGNIVAPSLVGSVEFAATQFGVRLVVVMGHTRCGAVIATLDQLLNKSAQTVSDNLRCIVDGVRQSLAPLLADSAAVPDEAAFLAAATRANICGSARSLREDSVVLRDLAHAHALRVVGAEYSLDTGEVDFFDGIEAVRAGHEGGH